MNSAIDISNVVLKTERLIIRPWKLSDLNDFYDYCKVMALDSGPAGIRIRIKKNRL